MGSRYRKVILLVLICSVLSVFILHQACLLPAQEEGALEKETEVAPEGEKGVPVEAPETGKKMTVWSTVLAGGWVMLVIGLLSLAALALIIEFFMSLQEKKLIPANLIDRIGADMDEGNLNAAIQKCDENPGIVSTIIHSGLINIERGYDIVREAVSASGEMEAEGLLNRINYLSIIGTLSPMLGLLGTVLGMIKAFSAIAFEAAAARAELLALSISQALITTAGGLIVGIPAMGFYFYFRGKGNRIIMNIERITTDLTEKLKGREIITEEPESGGE